jgi:hypothetical protein
MKAEKAPVKVISLIIGVVLIIGVGWWYLSRRGDCLERIVYVPETKPIDGDGWGRMFQQPHGAYYKLEERRHATHDEAMSACMGF